MRAIYLRDDLTIEVDQNFNLADERAHHLIKVCRVKVGETILALDGKGTKYLCEILAVSKRECALLVLSSDFIDSHLHIDLLLGLPKREAFELSVKNCVELGVRRIIPFEATFGQWKIKNIERVESLIESALIQSNNPYYTELGEVLPSLKASESIFCDYDAIILTTLSEGRDCAALCVEKSKKYLIIIGPEGGLSEDEEKFILQKDNSYALKLLTPILRTPNAVSAVIGFIHGKFAGL